MSSTALGALATISVEAPWDAVQSQYASDGEWVPVAVVAILAGAYLIRLLVTSRVGLAHKRLDLLQDLARRGQFEREMLDELAHPRKQLMKAVFVLAWFALIAGITMLVSAISEGWPERYNELGAPGAALITVALALISTPIMLREMKRQNIL